MFMLKYTKILSVSKVNTEFIMTSFFISFSIKFSNFFLYEMNIHLHDLVLSNMVSRASRSKVYFFLSYYVRICISSNFQTDTIMPQILLINHTFMLMLIEVANQAHNQILVCLFFYNESQKFVI
jgi:hypothetical protein